ncbi:MAG: hypothetical protein LBE83_02610 [Propionibacteriaceae bacterium]|jgi:hypothetical protein|nr:hypothetical protein [Propionibacteriaceae bacterium]
MRRYIALIVGVVLGFWLVGCSGSGSPNPTLGGTQLENLRAAADLYCSSSFNATITGAEEFNHPAWGPVLLATCLDETGSYSAFIMDATGVTQWTKWSIDVAWPSRGIPPSLTTYQPASPVTDASGNLYLEYAQIPLDEDGRPAGDPREGVEILRPTDYGIETIVTTDLEWLSLVGMAGTDEDALRDLPLFAPAKLDGLGEDGLYRIRMTGDEASTLPPLVFVWVDPRYELDLGPGQYELTKSPDGVPLVQVGPAIASLGLVTVQGSSVSLVICGSAGVSSITTCTNGIDYGLTANELTGQIGSDGNAIVSDSNYPMVWGIVVFEDGIPVRVDRPAETKCQYADGTPYTGGFGC